MERFQRRSQYVKRFLSDNVAPLLRRQSQTKTHLGRRQSWSGAYANDSQLQSQHGRLEVLSRSVRMQSVPSKLFMGNDEGEGNETEAGEHKEYETTQFRLSNRKPTNTLTTSVLGVLGIQGSDAVIYDDSSGNDQQCSCCGFEPNTYVTRYLHWTFRQSFLTVFFSAALGFFGGILFFALLLLWSGRIGPECIYVNGVFFGNATDSSTFQDFGDAFQLSWTNFATVGYGLTYPTTSKQLQNQGQCAPIIFLCALEAFVGVLFGSFCGAIMFGKVARVRSIAQVEFSDPLVVRYGQGVLVEDADIADDRSAKSASDSSTNASTNLTELPCPVLEFRIANQMHAITGGEIMDCTLNIVASIDGSRAESLLRSRSKRRRRRKGKAVGHRIERSIVDDSYRQNPLSESEKNKLKHLASRVVEQANRSELPFEEDPYGKIASKRVFSKLEVETPDHPFFKRVWTVRHTLDCESPILADDAKEAIRLNHGFWPREFNDAQCVRACLNFDQILVSFAGTSNADANNVYAQKVYDFESVSVGYVFVTMMYADDDHSRRVKVDLAVINDVTEQAGGGGEDLSTGRRLSNSDIYVL
ncbi:hypothetical protein MHU86_19997 [Fragilaria crotonensis]|nr:hypothetical protein MHU86_19997 [Fragilaria crotonensis]